MDISMVRSRHLHSRSFPGIQPDGGEGFRITGLQLTKSGVILTDPLALALPRLSNGPYEGGQVILLVTLPYREYSMILIEVEVGTE